MFSLFKCLFIHTCWGRCSSSGKRGSTDKRTIPRWNTPFLFHVYANLMNLVGACSSCSVHVHFLFTLVWFPKRRKIKRGSGNLAATSMMFKTVHNEHLTKIPWWTDKNTYCFHCIFQDIETNHLLPTPVALLWNLQLFITTSTRDLKKNTYWKKKEIFTDVKLKVWRCWTFP